VLDNRCFFILTLVVSEIGLVVCTSTLVVSRGALVACKWSLVVSRRTLVVCTSTLVVSGRFGRFATSRCTTILLIIESHAIIIGRYLFIHEGVVGMPVYNKLVRDRIPEIIEMSGKDFTTRILEEDDYLIEINKKMHEELAEYEEATSNEDSVEELADLLELIYAAANTYGTTIEELEKIRIHKAKKRGGFDERIFLVDVEDD
jgi:predicted house-cleaning noncanonical NTP pyrophosphatase (MazG superfamily)